MTAKIFHAEIWGKRDDKYQWFEDQSLETTDWQPLDPAGPFFLFKPFDQSEAGNYYDWPSITDVMAVNVTGIVTARDHFVIDFDREPLMQRIAELRDASISDQALRDKYFTGKGSKKYPPGDSRGWKLPQASQKLQADEHWGAHAAPILYRPFEGA